MISEQLQQRIRQGDREAFHELYSAYSRTVYIKVLSAVGHADRTREITRQVFLAIYQEICTSKTLVDVERRIAVLAGTYIQKERDAAKKHDVPSKETPSAAAKRETLDAANEMIRQRTSADSAQKTVPQAPRQVSDSMPVRPVVPTPRRKKSSGSILFSVFLCLMCVVFLWVAVGLLMEFGVFPAVDLGYTWFNSTVFRLFYSF